MVRSDLSPHQQTIFDEIVRCFAASAEKGDISNHRTMMEATLTSGRELSVAKELVESSTWSGSIQQVAELAGIEGRITAADAALKNGWLKITAYPFDEDVWMCWCDAVMQASGFDER